MKVFLVVIEIKSNDLKSTALSYKKIFAKKEQAEDFLINIFKKNKLYFTINATERVCQFLIDNKRELFIPFIKEQFNDFQFSIDEIQIEGHVLG